MLDDPKVIVALDFELESKVMNFIERLDPILCHLKVGITLFTQLGPRFVENLMKKGYSVFLDLKFHDIPNQVSGACRAAADLGVWMISVHTFGGPAVCAAAANAISGYQNPPLLMGVTVLTSASQDDLLKAGFGKKLVSLVADLAKLAEVSKFDGVICSAREVSNLRKLTKEGFIFVTPGIRLSEDLADDQKRIMTPQAAFDAGSHYLVLGRSITQAKDPRSMLEFLAQQNSKK